MIATEESAQERYLGVLCAHCRQPIPLPGIVVEGVARTDAEPDSAEPNIRSFHLRCRVCEREKTYRMGDIAEFEGSPRTRGQKRRVVFGPAVKVASAHG
jgi:hypothetical protein